MAIFLKGSEINAELEQIFEKANESLLIISPYIKLHERVQDVLIKHLKKPSLKITVVFGKNEDEMDASLSQSQFAFFAQFPNIEIRYERRLHAKFYANEEVALLSSMNLYEYSHNHNIEFGILSRGSMVGNLLGDNLDKDALEYFCQVRDHSELVFKREPIYKARMLGMGKKYLHSLIAKDKLSEIYRKAPKRTNGKKSKKEFFALKPGYCIRTRERIPFNPNHPLSDKAFNSWKRYRDQHYPEKYCHYSGEESYGDTSYARPILRKNLTRANEIE